MPPTKLTLAQAATMAERAPATLRRWIREGKLTRHYGAIPEAGGSAPVQVDQDELFTLLATSGQKPRVHGSVQQDTPPEHDPVRTVDHDQVIALQLEVAELRGKLALANAQGCASAQRAERLEQQLDEERRRNDQRHAELRADLALERDRTQALGAEIRALRVEKGVPWWRALFGPPAAPALDAEA